MSDHPFLQLVQCSHGRVRRDRLLLLLGLLRELLLVLVLVCDVHVDYLAIGGLKLLANFELQVLDYVLRHDFALKLGDLAALLLDQPYQLAVVLIRVLLIVVRPSALVDVRTDAPLLPLAASWLLACRVVHFSILCLAVLVDDLGGFGVRLTHLAGAEVAVDQNIVERCH